MIQKFAGFIAAEKGAITSLDQAPIKSRCIATVGSMSKYIYYAKIVQYRRNQFDLVLEICKSELWVISGR